MNEKFIVLNDVAYGSHERQKLDIFVPKKIKNCNGILLFIHGGGWSDGDKSAHHEDAQYFCENGFVCACLNYRFVNFELTVFDELDDITQALKVIKLECMHYECDIQKLLLCGGSAGAHLAMLYAYTRAESAPVSPAAVCAYCPPVHCASADFLIGKDGQFENWKYEILSECTGKTINKDNFLTDDAQCALYKISPVSYLHANIVPTAIFSGRKDEIVPIEHIQEFIEKLQKIGVKNDFLIYENSGHALDCDKETNDKAKSIIMDYAEAYLK